MIAHKKQNLMDSVEIEYSNACNSTGIVIPFGLFQLRVWLDCLVYIEAEYTEYDNKDRLLMGSPGEWEISFRNLDLFDPRLSVWVMDLQGQDVCQIFDNTLEGKDYSRREVEGFLQLPVDVTNGREVTLLEVLKEVVENEGPDQESKKNALDDWVESVESVEGAQ